MVEKQTLNFAPSLQPQHDSPLLSKMSKVVLFFSFLFETLVMEPSPAQCDPTGVAFQSHYGQLTGPFLILLLWNNMGYCFKMFRKWLWLCKRQGVLLGGIHFWVFHSAWIYQNFMASEIPIKFGNSYSGECQRTWNFILFPIKTTFFCFDAPYASIYCQWIAHKWNPEIHPQMGGGSCEKLKLWIRLAKFLRNFSAHCSSTF